MPSTKFAFAYAGRTAQVNAGGRGGTTGEPQFTEPSAFTERIYPAAQFQISL